MSVWTRPDQRDGAEVDALNDGLVTLFELANAVAIIELSSGRILSFSVMSQRDLTTTEKVLILGLIGTGFLVVAVTYVGGKAVAKIIGKADNLADATSLVDNVASISGVSRVRPKHHPFPMCLGGAADQTLKKIPRNLHYRFHASLDKWMGGKYARAHTLRQRLKA